MKARHHAPWSVVLLISWVLLFGASGVQRISPASDWMEVRSVRVFDTQAGVSPIMVVDRVIKQPFQGHWVTDVEREQTEGLFVVQIGWARHREHDKPHVCRQLV